MNPLNFSDAADPRATATSAEPVTDSSGLTLYEVAIADGASASPFVWRAKLALARKGLPYQSRMVTLTDIPRLFGGRFSTVPILRLATARFATAWPSLTGSTTPSLAGPVSFPLQPNAQ